MKKIKTKWKTTRLSERLPLYPSPKAPRLDALAKLTHPQNENLYYYAVTHPNTEYICLIRPGKTYTELVYGGSIPWSTEKLIEDDWSGAEAILNTKGLQSHLRAQAHLFASN